jgi:polyhydroxyalkanoate synthesis regulator phasin
MPKQKQNPLERYVTAGMAFSQLTRKRAESLVKDLVKEGEIGRDHANDWVEELVARSRRSAEHISELVRHEVKRQVDQLGLVNSDDVTKIVERFVSAARSAGEQTVRNVSGRAGTARRVSRQEAHTTAAEAESAIGAGVDRVRRAAKTSSIGRKVSAPAKKAPVKRAAPSKAAPAKAAAKKVAAKKVPAKKVPAKKAPAAKAAAAKAPAKKTIAWKTPARATKAPAKKAAGTRRP